MPARKIKKLKRGARRVKLTKSSTKASEPRSTPDPSPDTDAPRFRPTVPSAALLEAICERIANGQTTSEVVRDETMPTWNVLYRWREQDEDFNRAYTIARQSCCEKWADEIIEIADDASNDYVERVLKNGGTQTVWSRENFERSRLRVDSRKWTASKVLRHVYGEKSEVDLRTPDGVSIDVTTRNALIDSIVKLVQPKADPQSDPHSHEDERRER
jgi:hypothetical protein